MFPARCIGGCGRRGVALCGECRTRLPYLGDEVCRRCALPGRSDRPCRGCRRLAPSLSAVRAVCAYEGTARTAVHALKFRGGQYLGATLSELMVAAARTRPLRADVIVPVPLAAKRQRERGYNQASLLCQGLPETVGAAIVPRLLTREERPPQRALTADQRRANLEGSFSCSDPPQVAGKRVLLVDDVLTTGATLSACARVLDSAGAAWIGALVFARDL